jgi:hypothetical protein
MGIPNNRRQPLILRSSRWHRTVTGRDAFMGNRMREDTEIRKLELAS